MRMKAEPSGAQVLNTATTPNGVSNHVRRANTNRPQRKLGAPSEALVESWFYHIPEECEQPDDGYHTL
jgi:hypothetical protein